MEGKHNKNGEGQTNEKNKEGDEKNEIKRQKDYKDIHHTDSDTEDTIAYLVKQGKDTEIKEKEKCNNLKDNPQTIETETCLTCTKVFRSKRRVKQHQHSAHKKHKCTNC